MTIRPAMPADSRAIFRLLDENKMTLDGVRYGDFSPLCLVAERQGQVVGALQVLMGKPYASLMFLAVAKEHQAKGYGTKLFDACELVLRSYDIPAVSMGTEQAEVVDMLTRRGAVTIKIGMALVKVL